MTNNTSRKEELMDYVRTLRSLDLESVNSTKFLKDAVEELHELMLPRKEKVKVVVLEREKQVEQTTDYYKTILGQNCNVREDSNWDGENTSPSGHMKVSNLNTEVYIIDSSRSVREHLLPTTIDFLLNSTGDSDLPVKLGIKTG